MNETQDSWREQGGAQVSAISAVLKARCPRCGRGKLFRGYLNVASGCSACKLDFSPIDTGDGPAIFVILIAGAVVAGSALAVEAIFSPPYWLHAVLWLPLVLIMTLGLLRPVKSALIVLQFKHKAAEGRQDREKPDA